jgi:hypothetical protein
VKKLFIIHASSQISAEGEDPTQMSDGDKLAKIDREGWDLADEIVNSLNPCPHIDFARLQYLLFNTWDDGRWAAAERRNSMWSKEEYASVYPSVDVALILHALFTPVFTVRQVTICLGNDAVPGGRYLRDESWTYPRIYHRCAYQTPYKSPIHQGSPSTIYMKGDSSILRHLLDNDSLCDREWGEYLLDDQGPANVEINSGSIPKLE